MLEILQRQSSESERRRQVDAKLQEKTSLRFAMAKNASSFDAQKR